MKIFVKWTLNGLLFTGGILILTILTGEFDSSNIGVSIAAIIIGALMLGFFFYILEVKYLPRRKIKLTKKLMKVFNAEPVSDEIMRFKVGGIDFYTEVEFDLRISQHAAFEMIRFHIPRHQIDRLPEKPEFKYKEDNCNGIQTYNVYQTNGMGLKLAKRRFEKRIEKVKPTANIVQPQA